MVMGGKQGFCPQFFPVHAVFQHRPGNGHTVKGTGASADFVQQNQAVLGGIFQNARHLVHFHHKGRLSAGQVIGGADAGKHPVHHADDRLFCRNKGTDLRHEHNQRRLAHIRAFTGHIGAGDNHGQIRRIVQKQGVGYKQAVLLGSLHHRVAALFNINRVFVVHFRADISVSGSHVRQRAQHVQHADVLAGLLHPVHLSGHLLPHLGEEPIFHILNPIPGGEQIVFQFFQFLGEIPFVVHQGLFPDIIRRNIGLSGRFGHIDVIAEHFVVADFQFFDAGAFPLPLLHGQNVVCAMVPNVPKTVQLLAESGANHTTLPYAQRRLLADGFPNHPGHIFQNVQLCDFLQRRGGAVLHQSRQLRQNLAVIAQCRQIPGIGRAEHNAADDALKIAHVPQLVHQLVPEHTVIAQLTHSLIPIANGLRVEQGPLQPCPQSAAAHGGPGFIQYPQQAAPLFSGAQGFRQLQIPPGGVIQFHIPPRQKQLRRFQIAQIRLLGGNQIIQQRARRLHGMGHALQAQFLRGIHMELAAQQLLAFAGGKGIVQHLHHAAQLAGEEIPDFPIFPGALIQNSLPGGEPAQFVQNMLRRVLLERRRAEFTGRRIAECNAAPVLLAVPAHGAQIVGTVFVQHGACRHRAGGDDADHIPLDQPLCQCRVLHLLADGHFIPLGNQLCNVNLRRMIGHTTHGGALLRIFHGPVPGGQSQIQLPGGGFCVLVEHLVEVAQPEKQHTIRVLRFDFLILLFHRRQFSHVLPSISLYFLLTFYLLRVLLRSISIIC